MDHNQGSALLKAWMKDNGNQTQATFAEMLAKASRRKVTQSKVSDWLLGRHISLADAVAVRNLTGVPVESWLEPAVGARRLARAS